jgi:hypothetical protein
MNNSPPKNKHPNNGYQRIEDVSSQPYIAEILALIGALLFVFQQYRYSHLQPSVLDEGLYLYKGLLYVSRQYAMYQFYGPWSNKMPFGFLIPGAVQHLFGPGLGTGRFFAIVLGVLFLLGTWILARRLAGRWWAALLVWLMALNVALIKMYSLAVSQVLIACMLVWVLALVLGKDRPAWQIVLGALLAGLMVVTRINMALVIPIILLYITWQHGLKMGLISTALSALTVIVVHALFWPGILQVYALALPRSATPFLDAWRTPQRIPGAWNPVPTTENRLLSLFQTYRNHFFGLAAVFTASIFGFRRKAWGNKSDFRTFILLFSAFLVMLLAHMWASLGQGYCIYCLTSYLAFFAFIGGLILAVTYPLWRTKIPLWLQLAIVFVILISGITIGGGAYEQVGADLLEIQIPRSILELSPNASGTVPIRNYLRKTYDYDFKTSRRIVSASAGLVTAVTMVLLAAVLYLVYSALKRGDKTAKQSWLSSYGAWALLVFVLGGAVLTQTADLVQERNTYFCNRDVIASYRAAGQHIAHQIPPGSKVYWKGGNSAVPLLYLPDIQIYPSQLNGDYTFKNYGDPDTLMKHGYWSAELADQWLNEADFVLLQQRFYDEWYRERLKGGAFEELESTPPSVYCEENTHIRIFKRVN